MLITIQNESLIATISSCGAELIRLEDLTGETKYICPEANCHWENIAPVLFPNTGSVKDGLTNIQGKQYPYGKHGFARDSEFLVRNTSEESVLLELCSSEQTRKTFPFDFQLSIIYTLKGKKLLVETTIQNVSDRTMFCSIGFHPGFTCPIASNEKAEDYVIAFPQKTYASRLNLVDGLVESETKRYLDGILEIPVQEGMFHNGSYSLTDITANTVMLKSQKSGRYIILEFEDFPNLILWAPRYKPISVICMEPWYGRPDRADGEPDVSEKPNTLEIDTGCSRKLCFTVTCN